MNYFNYEDYQEQTLEAYDSCMSEQAFYASFEQCPKCQTYTDEFLEKQKQCMACFEGEID